MKLIIITLFGILLFSCKDNFKSDKKDLNYSEKAKLPRFSKALYELAKKRCTELNLQDLEYTKDSFEVRIWVEEIVTPKDLIIIKKIGKDEDVFRFWFYERMDQTSGLESMNKVKVDSFYCYKRKPDSNFIIDSLLILGITDLPTQDAIPGFVDKIGDGTLYTFEVLTPDGYKFFYYHCPDYYNDQYNKAATKILQFLRRHRIGINSRC